MKQGVIFLLLLIVALVLTGVVQSCEREHDTIVITDDMIVFK